MAKANPLGYIAAMSQITPVILVGGSGKRLWPLSRESMPKQFVPLLGKQSTFQQTLQHFVKAFGRQHFVDSEMFRARYPIQKAFLDFNLLLGAESIVSTGSNYASFAATLANSELTNVAVAGSLEQLETHLHNEYLRDIAIGSDARRSLRDELERQYARRSKMRPLEANEALPAAM